MSDSAGGITFDQEVKLQLVALAEYLQVKDGLSDVQIKLYAKELIPLGPDGLARAIALLKEDPEVWSGRFPLPAKLKQYVRGDVANIAINAARKVMSLDTIGQAYMELSPMELEIAREYGLKAIVERSPDQSPIVFAQLREMFRTRITGEREKHAIGYDRRGDTTALLEAGEAQEGTHEDGKS